MNCNRCNAKTDVVYADGGNLCASCLFREVRDEDLFVSASTSCENCGDNEKAVCWSCHEDASSWRTCDECGRDWGVEMRCEEHMPTEGCDECGVEERRLCNDCALEEWQLTPQLPDIVTNEDGTISMGETEVRWN